MLSVLFIDQRNTCQKKAMIIIIVGIYATFLTIMVRDEQDYRQITHTWMMRLSTDTIYVRGYASQCWTITTKNQKLKPISEKVNFMFIIPQAYVWTMTLAKSDNMDSWSSKQIINHYDGLVMGACCTYAQQ